MKFMITLLMAVLPALSFAQSQPEAGQGLPGGAIPKATAVRAEMAKASSCWWMRRPRTRRGP